MRSVLILLFVTFGTVCRADSVARPVPQIFVPVEGGPIVFAMIPEDHESGVREPFGVAYQLSSSGVLEELYRVEGWFSHSVFVSRDGRRLVRIGGWPEGHEPSRIHLAVAFYENGRLLKQYSTLDLLKNPGMVEKSVSHYRWMASPLSNDPTEAERVAVGPCLIGDRFILSTVDGWTYEFNAETGEVVAEKKTKG